MVYVRSRKFCCCLPVRFGTFSIAILGIVGGGLISIGGWLQVKDLAQHPIDGRAKIALWIQTMMYTVLAVVSLFGLIGTFSKSRSLIALYSTILFSHLGFSIATGAFYLYTLFHQEENTDVQKCINGSTDNIKIEACKKGYEVIRGVIVGLFILIWLIELYGCIIVSNYVDQLDEEESLEYGRGGVGPAVTTVNNNFVAPQPNSYAFGTPAHSYGVQGNSNNV